jgi:hypothetical protein
LWPVPIQNYFWNYHSVSHLVRLTGRGISPTQGLYLHKKAQHTKTKTKIHALSGFQTYDWSIQAARAHAIDRSATVLDCYIINTGLAFCSIRSCSLLTVGEAKRTHVPASSCPNKMQALYFNFVAKCSLVPHVLCNNNNIYDGVTQRKLTFICKKKRLNVYVKTIVTTRTFVLWSTVYNPSQFRIHNYLASTRIMQAV